MNATLVSRVLAGVLVLLVSAALGWGGVALRQGGPEAWPDVVANEATIKRTSSGMLALAALLLVAGAAALANLSWGGYAAAIATIVVVLLAFPANYALFGDIRPLHTGTNVVVGAVILALLWWGYSGPPR